MRPDPTYKTIFADPFMVEELMRWLVGDLHGAHELVDALDYSGLQRVHEQSVTSGTDGALHAYANDIVWRAPFHARREGDGGQRWLYLVVMVEFQSEVDYLMALRIRNYVDNFHMERWRGDRRARRVWERGMQGSRREPVRCSRETVTCCLTPCGWGLRI